MTGLASYKKWHPVVPTYFTSFFARLTKWGDPARLKLSDQTTLYDRICVIQSRSHLPSWLSKISSRPQGADVYNTACGGNIFQSYIPPRNSKIARDWCSLAPSRPSRPS